MSDLEQDLKVLARARAIEKDVKKPNAEDLKILAEAKAIQKDSKRWKQVKELAKEKLHERKRNKEEKARETSPPKTEVKTEPAKLDPKTGPQAESEPIPEPKTEVESPTKLERAASPQLEDGYTSLANEIAEQLARINLSAYQSRILWVILRQTYGWHKKMDQISITQFEKASGLKRWHVGRTLSGLIQRKIVTRIGNSRITSYGFQKDYTKWKDITKRGNDAGLSRVSEQQARKIVTRIGNRSLPKEVHTKETNKRNLYVEDSTELRLASFLLEEILRNKPDFKQPNIQKWAKNIDLMIRIDGRTPDRIREVITWVQGSWWRKNILSTEKLREKFDQLEIHMEDKKKDPGKTETQVQYEDLTGRGTA